MDHGEFVSSEYVAISCDAASEVTLTNMDHTDFSGSMFNGIGIRGGSLDKDATWDEAEVAHVLLGSLSVAYGVTLTWGPGVVVKPLHWVNSYPELVIYGTLNAAGGPGAKRIYVTSIKDDTVGGNTDGVADSGDPGDWDGIYFLDGSSGALSHVSLQYGGEDYYGDGCAACVFSASLSIGNSVLRQNTNGVVSSSSSASIEIHNCEIRDNDEYGVYNSAARNWIDATSNWWGSSSGPHDPSGSDGQSNDNPSGDRVSDYVQYYPWLSAQPDFCDPCADQVALYANTNYGGDCVPLGIGDYPNPGYLGELGNDNAESIKVGSNVEAVLCEHNNYEGRCETFTGNDSNLGNNYIAANAVSSVRVQSPDATPPTGQITAPEDGAVITSCPLMITADASDDQSGVSHVEFHAAYDSSWHHLGDDYTSPYSWSWDCSSVSDQGVWLTVHIWDNAGNEVMDPGGYVYITLARATVGPLLYDDHTVDDDDSGERGYPHSMYQLKVCLL